MIMNLTPKDYGIIFAAAKEAVDANVLGFLAFNKDPNCPAWVRTAALTMLTTVFDGIFEDMDRGMCPLSAASEL
jgi:hypothetical protein